MDEPDGVRRRVGVALDRIICTSQRSPLGADPEVNAFPTELPSAPSDLHEGGAFALY